MLNFFSIKNFKAFKCSQFELSMLNIIAGANGVGKSSFIQSLLLLRQSYEKNILNEGLLLNGDYVQIGSSNDAMTQDTEETDITFYAIWDELTKKNVFSYEYALRSDFLNVSDHACISPLSELSKLSLFNEKLKYLSADREPPQDSYKKSKYYVERLKSVGIRGEYAPHFIHQYANEKLSSEKLKHAAAKDMSLITNINAWLSEISPNISLTTSSDDISDSIIVNYFVGQNNGLNYKSAMKPKNTGFGISIALPVITVLLSSKPGDLIIIENPEAHLQPHAQNMLGRLCAAVASAGIQIILETHSDHLFNGMLIAVKQGIISHDLTSVFYIERNETSDAMDTVVIKPEITKTGRIQYWPNGFMDQWDNELDQLL